MKNLSSLKKKLIEAALQISERSMNILGEGNLSARVDEGHFLVKASGTSMTSLKSKHLILVKKEPFLQAIESGRNFMDTDVEQMLLNARVDPKDLKPSVETLFHAWLLNLPGVEVVGHCHASAVNQILCSPEKTDFARKRLFPDQIVYCGPASVLVPYADPGLILAREIARNVMKYISAYDRPPRTILLENHGLITLGSSHQEMVSAALMTEKSAEIYLGACLLGGPVFMEEEAICRIDHRLDEEYRRKISRDHS